MAESGSSTRRTKDEKASRESLGKLEIRSKHRLGSQGFPDDIVDVEEQPREPFCEVRQETFRHRTQMPLQIFRHILVVVFLHAYVRNLFLNHPPRKEGPTLFLSALNKSCTLLPSYFLNFPRFSINTLSNLACQSFPTIPCAPFSSIRRYGSFGSLHMISNLSDASCKKFRRRPGFQKNGCSRHVVVSGL
jgi:hypothetical protein